MAEFWEQDQVAPPAAPPQGGGENFWANDAVVQGGRQPLDPVPPSDAFAARVAHGVVLSKAFAEEAAKPYSQRLKEWTANELKEGNYGRVALGTLATTIAEIPEAAA